MVDIVTSITRGGPILPEPVERVVRASPLAWGPIAVGETYASVSRTALGEQDPEDTEVTVGPSPFFTTRFTPLGEWGANIGGNTGTVGEWFGETRVTGGGVERDANPNDPLSGIARALETIVRNLPLLLGGVLVLGVILALGNLFTFVVNVGDGQ